MKDVEGVELQVDDVVRTTRQAGRGGQYSGLAKARVIGFTPKRVRVQFIEDDVVTLKTPESIIKVGV